MKRKAQRRLEIPAERMAEGKFRGVEHGVAVPRIVGHKARGSSIRREATQDDEVPRCALCGLDGAQSAVIVATRGDLHDVIERKGRALGARDLDEAERLLELT